MRIRTVNSGMGYDVWTVGGTWFWLSRRPDGGGGAIGAAPTKAEAVCEACLALEQLSEPLADDELSPHPAATSESAYSRGLWPHNNVALTHKSRGSEDRLEYLRAFKLEIGNTYRAAWDVSLASYASRVNAALTGTR